MLTRCAWYGVRASPRAVRCELLSPFPPCPFWLRAGSSQYNASANFLVYGGFKVRDGINRAHSGNLIYGGKAADYQCDGYNSTSFNDNTVIGTIVGGKATGDIGFNCVGKAFGAQGSYNSVSQSNNRYFGDGLRACGMGLAALQAAGYERGSSLAADLSVDAALAMARAMLMP